MQDLILEVTIPTEDRVEIKNGQRKVKTRKLYPGYVVIKDDCQQRDLVSSAQHRGVQGSWVTVRILFH